jgi:hypothetical protein
MLLLYHLATIQTTDAKKDPTDQLPVLDSFQSSPTHFLKPNKTHTLGVLPRGTLPLGLRPPPF